MIDVIAQYSDGHVLLLCVGFGPNFVKIRGSFFVAKAERMSNGGRASSGGAKGGFVNLL